MKTNLENKSVDNKKNELKQNTLDNKIVAKVSSDPEKSVTSESDEDYQIGDIVWAKIGKYPFWPSIVCNDPESNIYVKGSLKEDKNKFSLHVRFFNDNGRRSWAKIVENYCDKKILLEKYPDCLSFIKNNKRYIQSWNVSIQESNEFLKSTREQRIIMFFNANNLKLNPPNPDNSSTVDTTNNTATNGKENSIDITACNLTNNKAKKGIKRKISSKGENELVKNKRSRITKPRKKPVKKKKNDYSEDENDVELFPLVFTCTVPGRTVPESIKANVDFMEKENKIKIQKKREELLLLKDSSQKPQSSKMN